MPFTFIESIVLSVDTAATLMTAEWVAEVFACDVTVTVTV